MGLVAGLRIFDGLHPWLRRGGAWGAGRVGAHPQERVGRDWFHFCGGNLLPENVEVGYEPGGGVGFALWTWSDRRTSSLGAARAVRSGTALGRADLAKCGTRRPRGYRCRSVVANCAARSVPPSGRCASYITSFTVWPTLVGAGAVVRWTPAGAGAGKVLTSGKQQRPEQMQ